MIYFEFIRQNTIVVTITLNINTFLKLHYMIISVRPVSSIDTFILQINALFLSFQTNTFVR